MAKRPDGKTKLFKANPEDEENLDWVREHAKQWALETSEDEEQKEEAEEADAE